jgi:hypothetical protein
LSSISGAGYRKERGRPKAAARFRLSVDDH